MKKLLIASAIAALTSAAFAASNPATTQFDVLLKVVSACTVSSGTNVDFGSVDSTAAAALTANANAITVTCSKGTKYTIGLTPSNSNTTGAGVMKSATAPTTQTDTVAYQLRSAAGTGGAVWGNTNTSGTVVGNGVSGTGTGVAINHMVYATVADATTATPDNYKDTVQVTVRY